MRIGVGYDAHRFTEDRPLILGGVHIPYHKGLLGHSDADVLTHVIMDAMLGACALGSIGHHFPDTDPQYKDCSSIDLLKHVHKLILDKGYDIGNIDTVIAAEQPKLNPHIDAIQQHLASVLNCPREDVSIKATTTEKMGPVGREEGIFAYATILLKKRND